MKSRQILYWLGGCIIIIYLSTAVHSSGFYHPDEHFQLIEFAGLKAGWNTGADLTWEYDALIRPALQPFIALVSFDILDKLHVEDPFIKALFLRELTALLAMIVITFFIRSFWHTIQPANRILFICVSFLLWFIPVINVRFSSESWSGLCLLLAVAWLNYDKKRRKSFCMGIGFLLGIGFEFRFQLALCIVGLFLWLRFIGKWNYKQLFYLMGGTVFAILLSTLIDCWFYDRLVFVPYHYFKKNIVENVASDFGISPWYYYLYLIVEHATVLIGLTIIAAIISSFFRDYRSIIVWCLFPFLLAHLIIPHKELRFLFPVINFIPILLIWFYQWVMEITNHAAIIRKAVVYPLLVVMIIINTGGLVMEMFKPAGNGRIEVAHYIQKEYKNRPVTLYVLGGDNPYAIGTAKGFTARFYWNNHIHITDLFNPNTNKWAIESLEEIKDTDLIVLPLNQRFYSSYIYRWGFKEEKRGIPFWISIMNKFYKTCDDNCLVLYSKKNNSLQ